MRASNFCPYCGEKLSEGWVACPRCGRSLGGLESRLDATEASPPSSDPAWEEKDAHAPDAGTPPARRWLWAVVPLVVVALLAGGIVGWQQIASERGAPTPLSTTAPPEAAASGLISPSPEVLANRAACETIFAQLAGPPPAAAFGLYAMVGVVARAAQDAADFGLRTHGAALSRAAADGLQAIASNSKTLATKAGKAMETQLDNIRADCFRVVTGA